MACSRDTERRPQGPPLLPAPRPNVSPGLHAEAPDYRRSNERAPRTPHGLEIAVLHGIDAIADEWEALADRVGATPFARPGWLQAWFQTFADGPATVVTVRAREGLVGVLPLVRSGGTLSSPTNWHSPSFEILAENPDAVRALLTPVLGARRLSIRFLAPAAAGVIVAEMGAAGYVPRVRQADSLPVLTITGDWPTFFGSRVSRNLRSTIRRREARLRAAGAWEFEVLDGSEHCERFLEEGFRIEATSWKGGAGTAIVSRPDTHQFYREIGRWAAGRGSLRLSFLRLEGRAIAFDMGLEEAGRFYSLKPGYDPEFSDLSPGRMLQRFQLERAFEIGLESFDFGGSPNRHKTQWGPDLEPRVHVEAFDRSIAGRAALAVHVHGAPLARRGRALARTARLRTTHAPESASRASSGPAPVTDQSHRAPGPGDPQ